MRIERIEPAKTPRGCFVLRFSDEEESLTVTKEELASFGLFAGAELDGTEIDALRGAAEESIARRAAARILGVRDLSRRELLEKLRARGIAPEAAAAAADRMRELGLQNDASYAAGLVRRYAARGWGADRVRHELLSRGIDRELWEAAFAEAPDWEQAAADYLASHYPHGAERLDERERRRRAAALMRRGFSWEIIRRVLPESGWNEELE